MDSESGVESVEEMPGAAAGYMDLIYGGLAKAVFQSRFDLQYPAPSELNAAQLAILADGLKRSGWRAEVAPMHTRRKVVFGIRVTGDTA